jgi:hypothetical protein
MKNESPARRTILLRDCVFICCLPLDEQCFQRIWSFSEFCGQFDSWAEYQEALEVNQRSEELAYLSELGLRGTQAASFPSYCRAIVDRPLLLGLLGHCRLKREIEFADGFMSLAQVAGALPRDYGGIFDLAVCRPKGFVNLAKARAKRSFVRTARADLNARDFLLYYVTLFLNIAKQQQFASALVSTIDEFAKARSSTEPR